MSSERLPAASNSGQQQPRDGYQAAGYQAAGYQASGYTRPGYTAPVYIPSGRTHTYQGQGTRYSPSQSGSGYQLQQPGGYQQAGLYRIPGYPRQEYSPPRGFEGMAYSPPSPRQQTGYQSHPSYRNPQSASYSPRGSPRWGQRSPSPQFPINQSFDRSRSASPRLGFQTSGSYCSSGSPDDLPPGFAASAMHIKLREPDAGTDVDDGSAGSEESEELEGYYVDASHVAAPHRPPLPQEERPVNLGQFYIGGTAADNPVMMEYYVDYNMEHALALEDMNNPQLSD